MTAEVVVMNKGAIAIAADSAVTISHEDGSKIYNTAHKLFNISQIDAIGLMVYNNAEVAGYPWETLVKEFRFLNKNRNFDTIKECAECFIKYVGSIYFSKNAQDRCAENIIIDKFKKIRQDIAYFIESHIENAGDISSGDADFIINDLISEEVSQLSNKGYSAAFQDIDEVKLAWRLRRIIVQCRKSIFDEYDLNAETNKMLTRIGVMSITRKHFSEHMSAVVIAGFGGKEMFPSLACYYIDGFIDGKLKCDLNKIREIDEDNSAAIYPFAQSDMMFRFMEGVDPDYQNFLTISMGRVMSLIPEIFAERYIKRKKSRTQAISDMSAAVDKAKEIFSDELKNYRWENFVNPVIENVRFLPKDELAILAESLVNITSLKRRMSMDLETVGGPIDVAVISRRDGFIWIKRKQIHEQKSEW